MPNYFHGCTHLHDQHQIDKYKAGDLCDTGSICSVSHYTISQDLCTVRTLSCFVAARLRPILPIPFRIAVLASGNRIKCQYNNPEWYRWIHQRNGWELNNRTTTKQKHKVAICIYYGMVLSLQWRHNEGDGVWNHGCLDCLLNSLFRRRSKKTPKLCAYGLCEGNPPVTGGFPSQRASNAENVSIWWRHHITFKGNRPEGSTAGTLLHSEVTYTCSICMSVLQLTLGLPRDFFEISLAILNDVWSAGIYLK